jgi:ribose transport system permease protein
MTSSSPGNGTRFSLTTVLSYLSFRRISGVYVWAALFLLFSLWVPDTFLTRTTWIDIASSQAVTAMVALGLVLPLAAGAYDLSVGQALGVSAILSAWLVHKGADTGVAIGIAILAGVGIGIVNGILVSVLRMNSFIATLGMSSILLAVVGAISNNQQIIGLSSTFEDIGTTELLGIPIPVFYMLAIAVLFWWVLEHTPFGRSLFAIGGGREAARLAGVRVRLYLFLALVVCSTTAAFAGVVVTGKLGAGSPDIGGGYLLPAFAAAFLGATQIKPGRFNVVGTLLAVYLLATGVKGLQLAGASFWVTELFNGAVLIIAVGLSQFEGQLKLRNRAPLWRRRGGDPAAGDPGVAASGT